MTTMYAAVKWPVAAGPKPGDVQNDLEILALTLRDEHAWKVGDIVDLFEWAIDRVEDEAR
jgi:hypothetical protein